MLKGIGKLLKAGANLGKPFALKAAAEAIENSVPCGDLALDIARPFLPDWLNAETTETIAASMQDISDEDFNKLAEMLVNVMALAEVAARARMDGEITPEETEAVFDCIDELRQQAEPIVMAL